MAVRVTAGDTMGGLVLQGWACPKPPWVGALSSMATRDGASQEQGGPSATSPGTC